MDRGLKLLELAVGVLLLAIVIGVGITYATKGIAQNNKGGKMIDQQLSSLSSADKTVYDGGSFDGTGVQSTIAKYATEADFVVIVSTKSNGNFMYSGDFANDGSTAEVATAKANAEAAAASLWEYSGFPKADAAGVAIPTTQGTAQGTTTTTKFNGLQWSASYDGTLGSGDQGYISSNASFVSSIQKDQNNDVKCITFVQQ